MGKNLNRSQGEMCTREGLAMGLEVPQQLFSPRLQAAPLLRTRNPTLDNTPAVGYILYICDSEDLKWERNRT